ncbi:TRY1 protein, partial [Bucco capensis]|nr:TRY1 protein [Bucco capensis]
RTSSKFFIHPSYEKSTKDGDLMLLKLHKAVQLNKEVQALPLANKCPMAGQRCQISGWGSTTSPAVTFPEELHCAKVTILSQELCRNIYPSSITSNMICAGQAHSRADSCQGDSGGPLVCDGLLQGIVSWGPGICGDPKKPGVYVNICRYIPWLQETI